MARKLRNLPGSSLGPDAERALFGGTPNRVHRAEPHFNPNEPRDAHGRWMIAQAIERAISGLKGITVNEHNDGVNYAKAAYAKANEAGLPHVKAQIGAALESKPSHALVHLTSALKALETGKPQPMHAKLPGQHSRHGLAIHVSRALVSHVRTEISEGAKPTMQHRHQILRARSILPDGHPARFQLAKAYHAPVGQAMQHLNNAFKALSKKTNLPEGTDTRHRKAAGRYLTRKLNKEQKSGRRVQNI